jgi:hypothetical protein
LSQSPSAEQVTGERCAVYLRERQLKRIEPPAGAAQLGGAEASSWRRPGTIGCELCGAPYWDGNRIAARIAIVNSGVQASDVYLQSANHGPLWFETVPALPAPTPLAPLPEVFPAAALLRLPARSASDTFVKIELPPDPARRSTTQRVKAAVVFWNEGMQTCAELEVVR